MIMTISRDQAVEIAIANAPAGGYTDAQVQEWADWAVSNPDVQYSPNPAQQMANAMSVAQSSAGETPSYDVTPIDIGGGYQSAGYDYGTYEAAVPASGGLTFGQAKSIIQANAPKGGYTEDQLNQWATWAISNPDVLYSSDPTQQIINSLVVAQEAAGETPTAKLTPITPTPTATGTATGAAGSLLSGTATADPRRVTQLYYELLGRAPDAEGLAYWSSQPAYNLESQFYKTAIPEIQQQKAKQLAEIPISTNIPKPLMGTTPPGAPDVRTVNIPGQYLTTNYDEPQPLTVDISTMPTEQRDLTNLIVGRMPRPTTTTPGPVFTPSEVNAQLELERLKAMNAPATPAETPVAGFAQGGMVGNDINRMLQNQRNAIQRESQSRQMLNTMGAPPVKKFSDGGPAGSSSSGVRRLKMSGYQDGGDVSSNRFAQMMEDDQRAQDQFVGDINRQLSELITRYRSGEQGVTEKDLLPFFPGYSEYDIAQMYGMTTEAANPRMSEKINPFTVDMIPGIKGRGEAVQRDYDRMVREKRLLDPMMPKKIMTLSDGGDVSNDAFIQEMMTGTPASDEKLQSVGEYLKSAYKENIPVHARVYLETLLGKKDPVTAEDFTKEELADIEKLLASKPAKGAVTKYAEYEKVRDLDKKGRISEDWMENLPNVGKTLGRFTYETRPDGTRVIKDTYDFYNTSRVHDVQEFEGMKPAEKALAVLKKITAKRSMMDPPFVKRAADILGNAYIGRDGRPVEIEYDPKDLPVKRQAGSPPEGEISNDEFIKSLGDRSRSDLATIKEAVAEIGKNKDKYAFLESRGFTPTDIEDPVKNAAYGLFLTSKTSEDPQRFLSTLSPFYDSKIEFDYTTDRSTLGEVQPYSTEARVYTTDDRGVALHELVHTLQMRRAKDIAEGKKEINQPMSRTVGDKVFQRAADLAKKGEITFPATNWKQDKGELMANIYDMSRKYEEAGKDFTKSIEFKKLFPDEESQLYYYTQTLPDTSVVYPAGSSFEPLKTRDKSKSYARQLLGFAAGGEITKFIKDKR